MAKWIFDAGHGGVDPGATYKNRKECDDALKLVLRVGELLKANGETVLYTRTINATLTLAERSNFEIKNGCDYFVSIHRNAFNPEVAKGVETFIYNGTYGAKEKCRSLATKVNTSVVNASGYSNRGVKEANYHVLRETKNPAILIEVGFIDNTGDNNIFDSKFESIAQAIAKGCLEQVGKTFKLPATQSQSTEEIYYRCICGSYKDKNNAISQQEKLKKAGFDSFLEAFKK